MINYDEINRIIANLDKYVSGLKSVTETQSILEKSSSEFMTVKKELDSLLSEIRRFAEVTQQAEQMRGEILQSGLSGIKDKLANIESRFNAVDKNISERISALQNQISEKNTAIQSQITETEKKVRKRHKALIGAILGVGGVILIAVIIGFFL